MPTNILRKQASRLATGTTPRRRTASEPREIFLHSGRIVVRARLLETLTSDRIRAMLPIYSTAETWGRSLLIATRLETGRERGAIAEIAAGDIAYWSERDRVIVAFGRTPLSLRDEIRLPAPCNVFARALDDVRAFAAIQPGAKIAILEAAS